MLVMTVTVVTIDMRMLLIMMGAGTSGYIMEMFAVLML